MSSSKSSSSTRRNAARWISPSTNRNIFSGIPDKISRSRCSSAEIRSCRVIFFFLGTKSPLSRDSRVVHARAASKKKGPPLGPQPPAPAHKTGGAMPPRHRSPELAQQTGSNLNLCYAWPHGIPCTATANCLGCMRCSNPANCFRPAAEYGRRQYQPLCVLAADILRKVHVHVESHIAVLFPIQLCDTPAEIGP